MFTFAASYQGLRAVLMGPVRYSRARYDVRRTRLQAQYTTHIGLTLCRALEWPCVPTTAAAAAAAGGKFAQLMSLTAAAAAAGDSGQHAHAPVLIGGTCRPMRGHDKGVDNAARRTSNWKITHINLLYSVPQERIPDIIDCDLKKDYQILIIFGTHIPDIIIISHPMTVQLPTSPSVCSCTTWGNSNKQNITFLFKLV